MLGIWVLNWGAMVLYESVWVLHSILLVQCQQHLNKNYKCYYTFKVFYQHHNGAYSHLGCCFKVFHLATLLGYFNVNYNII